MQQGSLRFSLKGSRAFVCALSRRSLPDLVVDGEDFFFVLSSCILVVIWHRVEASSSSSSHHANLWAQEEAQILSSHNKYRTNDYEPIRSFYCAEISQNQSALKGMIHASASYLEPPRVSRATTTNEAYRNR